MMKERLPVQTVERLHRLLAGDAGLEDTILTFIAGRYGARSLIYLPARVAEQILKRPADFIRVAKQHCEPELGF
jgi:hypothetical protein